MSIELNLPTYTKDELKIIQARHELNHTYLQAGVADERFSNHSGWSAASYVSKQLDKVCQLWTQPPELTVPLSEFESLLADAWRAAFGFVPTV